jgi:aminoglycoside phosphotransferase (APT) family kinase protein
MDESPLHGGFVNTVVRVGETVRRKAGPWTATTQRLLAHVRNRGLTWVPEPLGLDLQGREVLSFIPGEVPHEMPDWVWSEATLNDAARALRQWHDATADFQHAGAVWNLPARDPSEVVCHNDFAPYNCVFRDGRFVGAIDFDVCAPGPRVWDIAYTAYRFVPLMPGPDVDALEIPGEKSPFRRAVMEARLNDFLEAYDSAGEALRYEGSTVLESVIERLDVIAAWTENHARTNGVVALEGHARMYRAHARWLGGRSA